MTSEFGEQIAGTPAYGRRSDIIISLYYRTQGVFNVMQSLVCDFFRQLHRKRFGDEFSGLELGVFGIRDQAEKIGNKQHGDSEHRQAKAYSNQRGLKKCPHC